MQVKLVQLNKVVDVQAINIVGNSLASDIFYKYGDKFYPSSSVEMLEIDEKVKEVQEIIQRWSDSESYFKFAIDIDLDEQM